MSARQTRARGGASAGRRLARGLEALLAAVLALGAAVLAVDLADWRYARVDLSASGHNTLDPELEAVLDRLPEPARIDLFLRPLDGPYAAVHAEAAARFRDELQRIVGARRDVLEVVDYAPQDLEASLARQQELGVQGTNVVVVSRGDRRAVLRLYGDVASVDWGNPTRQYLAYLDREGITNVVDPRTWDPNGWAPPRVTGVRAASALADALLRVGAESRPLAVFVQGHGESDPEAEGPGGLSRLSAMLEREGFAVEPWLGARDGALPADADLVLLVAPRQPLAPEDLEALDDYVRGGGRLLVAPSLEELDRDMQRGARDVMAAQGLALQDGIVCLAYQGRGGARVDGSPSVARFRVGENGLAASHPVTTPLRADGRAVEFWQTPAFAQAGLATVGGASSRTRLTLVHAPPGAWLDLPVGDEQGGPRFDFRYDPGTESDRGRLPLVMTSEYPLSGGGGRVLAFGSSLALEDPLFDANLDLLRNAANWLADREARIRIAARNPLSSRLDLREGNALTILNYTLWLGLPLGCGLVALGVAVRRRRA